MNGVTGRWEENAAGFVGRVVGWVVDTIDANWESFRFLWAIAIIGLVFFGVYQTLKLLTWSYRKTVSAYRSFQMKVQRLLSRMEKNRIFRGMKGKFMAKWKIGMVGTKIDDALFDLEMLGLLSNQEGRRLRNKIGRAIGDWQLIPRKVSKAYFNWYFKGASDPETGKISRGYQKLAGPAKTIPGPKPGEDVAVAPKATGNVSNFVLKLREKKANAA